MPKTKKTEALSTPEEVAALVNSRFGAGTILRGSDPSLEISRIPSGILSVDVALDGGFARGRTVEVYGSFGVGKSYLSLCVLAQCQQMGLRGAYVDAEGTFNADFAESVGIDVEDLDYHRQKSGNQVVDFIEILLRSRLYGVIVLDSIASLLPKQELEQDMEQSTMGTFQARLMSAALRRLTTANHKTVLFFVNQQRETIGSMFKQMVTSGGRAMGFYASTRLELVRSETLKSSGKVLDPKSGKHKDTDKIVTGHRVLVKVSKDKMQPVSEPVLTPRGWKAIGDIRVGNKVIGSNGKPTRVTGVYPQESRKVLRVTCSDGSSTRCGPEHLWKVQHTVKKRDLIKTTEELKARLYWGRAKLWRLPLLSSPAQLTAQLPLDPYVLGLLLGDGNLRKHAVRFSNVDDELLMEMGNRLPFPAVLKKETEDNCSYSIVGGGINPVLDAIRSLGLCGTLSHTKFVPLIYKNASSEDRLLLLQGLLDTDGFIDVQPIGSVSYGLKTTSPYLARDAIDIVRSLGGTALYTCESEDKERPGHKRVHRATINMPVGMAPFRLSRKAMRMVPRTRLLPTKLISSITEEPDEDSVCIRVAAKDGLYVTSDYIVTHNTGVRPMSETTFVFDYEQGGVDPIEDLIYLGRTYGLVHISGNKWYVDDYEEDAQMSRGKFVRWLRKNRAIAEELEERIREEAFEDED